MNKIFRIEINIPADITMQDFLNLANEAVLVLKGEDIILLEVPLSKFSWVQDNNIILFSLKGSYDCSRFKNITAKIIWLNKKVVFSKAIKLSVFIEGM